MIGSTLIAAGSATFPSAFHLHSVATASLLAAVFQLFCGTGQYLVSRMAHRRAMIVVSFGLVFSQIGLTAVMSLDWVVLFAVSLPLSGLFNGAEFVGSVGFDDRTVAPNQRTGRMSNLYLIGYFLSSARAVILGFLADRVGISNAFLLFSFAAILRALAVAMLSKNAGSTAMPQQSD